MNFELPEKSLALVGRVSAFMGDYIYPNLQRHEVELNERGNRWKEIPLIEELKLKGFGISLCHLTPYIANLLTNLPLKALN